MPLLPRKYPALIWALALALTFGPGGFFVGQWSVRAGHQTLLEYTGFVLFFLTTVTAAFFGSPHGRQISLMAAACFTAFIGLVSLIAGIEAQEELAGNGAVEQPLLLALALFACWAAGSGFVYFCIRDYRLGPPPIRL